MDLLDLGPEVVRRATSEGADGAEAFLIGYGTRSVTVEDDAPKVAEDREEVGLGLKVSRGKRVAFTSATLATRSDAASAVKSAVATLRRVPEDPRFRGFPGRAGRGSVPGTWDGDTAATGAEELVEAARTFTDAVRESKGVSVPKATLRVQDFRIRVANRNGVEASHEGTLVFGYLTAKKGARGSVGEGILKVLSPSIRDVDFADLGHQVARRAAENLAGKPFKGRLRGVAVLDPLDLGEMLLQSVGAAVNGEDVHRKRSPWTGKKGEAVASRSVTIRDRPRLPHGMASCASDDEGSPTRDRDLVLAGTLRGFLADHYHARLVRTRAGNGFRRAVATVEGAYTRMASAQVSNLVVEPGRKSREDLIADVDRGVYVEKLAAPEVNPFSGTFACEVRNATLIRRGELRDHVKLALLQGNVFEGLRHVAGIGRDLHASHSFLLQPGCSYVPTMAFEGFELVGQT